MDTSSTIESNQSNMGTITKPRIGFLGVGWIGANRLSAIRKSESAEIAAVCDPFSDHLDRICKENDLQKANSFDELLESDIDGVVIATPSALHREQTIRALNAGKAVFCQKPLSCSLEDTQEILDIARQRDCLLSVDMSYRYTSALRKIRHAIQDGELGKIFFVQLTFHNAYGPDKKWYYDRKLSGGGCVMDLGVHLLDLFYWIFPNATLLSSCSDLYAQGKPYVDDEPQVEDFAATHFRFTDNLTAQMGCSWNLSAGKDALIEFNFYGTSGGATCRNVHGSFYDFKAELYHGTKSHVLSLPPDDWGSKAIVEWTELLSGGNRYNGEAEGYLKTAETLDIIYGR